MVGYFTLTFLPITMISPPLIAITPLSGVLLLLILANVVSTSICSYNFYNLSLRIMTHNALPDSLASIAILFWLC